MRKFVISAVMALAVSSTLPSAAQACQGPQFETSLHIFSERPFGATSDGNIQLKVIKLEPKYWMEKYSRDFFFARVLEGKYINKTLMIKKPIVTSCDRMGLVPKETELYVSGAFARVRGTPMNIYSALLFAVDPATVKRSKPGFILPEKPAT